MGKLVKIERLDGVAERVAKGAIPIAKAHITDEQYVIGCSMERINPYSNANIDRKTEDWSYTIYVASEQNE